MKNAAGKQSMRSGVVAEWKLANSFGRDISRGVSRATVRARSE